MIQFLFLLMSGTTEYGPWHAHQDSMYIHKAYKQAAEILEKTSQPERWSVVDDSVSKITAGAFMRLSKYNHETYESDEALNKEGVGATFAYPEPSKFVKPAVSVVKSPEPPAIAKAPAPFQVSDHKEIAFKVLDPQTRFLVNEKGKTIAPYVIMNYYAKGRILVKSEKLNPVTLEPIQAKEQAAIATAE